MGFAAFFAELAYTVLNLSSLPMYVGVYLKQVDVLGVILSVFLLTEALSRPWFGALGDKIGRKPLLIAGPAITAVTAYLTIVYQGPYVVAWLIMLRAIDGLGSGALWPSIFAAIGDVVEEKHRTTAMSVLNVTYMSGLALGFLMGGIVNERFHSYTASFYLVTVLFVLSLLIMVVFLPKKIGAHHPKPMHGEPMEVPTLEEPTEFKVTHLFRSFKEIPELIVLACVVFFGTGLLMPIVKLYAVEHLGLSEKQFGLLVAPAAAVMGLTAVPLGRLGDKYGKCAAVCWGIFGSAVAMWVLALFRSIILAGMAGIVLGLGFTLAFPAWMALVSTVTSSNRRGEVLGAVGMAQGLAAILGASLGAYIYSKDFLSFPRLGVVNYNVPFWLSAILLSAGSVVAFSWMYSRYCGKDTTSIIKPWHRKMVTWGAFAGLVVLMGWVGYRYTLPVPPDRVAWQWVQQLVENEPKKAAEFTAPEAGRWDPETVTESTAKKYYSWHHDRHAVYVVLAPESKTRKHAVVPVRFRFPNREVRVERVALCKQESGEWLVCGLHEEK